MVGLRFFAAAMLLAGAAAAADPGLPVRNGDVHELSGLALSRRDPGVLWGHNDTGAGPFLYRLGLDGADLGRVAVPEAGAGDWEDIAAFDHDGPALLIADVGDNLAFRTFVTLYAIREPLPGAHTAPLLWRLDFRYPDGPRDCEAVAVDAAAREVVLITKRDVPARIYRLALPRRSPGKQQVAEHVGVLPPLPSATLGERVRAPLTAAHWHMPTALDISRDGLRAVVVTPRNAYLYRRRPGERWHDVLAQNGVVVRLRALRQIEAGALSPDGTRLLIGSEGRPSRLAQVPLPH